MDSLAELRSLIGRHAGSGPAAPAGVGIKVVSATAPTKLAHHVMEPIFAIVAQGAKRAVLGNETFEYGAGQFLVVSVDLPIAGHISRASSELPYLAAGMTLEPASIATLLLEMPADDSPAVEPAGFGVSDAPVDLLQTVARLAALRAAPGG